MRKHPGLLLVFLLALGWAEDASAKRYQYDLALESLFSMPSVHQECSDPTALSPSCQATLNTAWRSLMSQLGVLFAPQFLAPSETPGYSGFVFDFKYGLTSLKDTADFWKYGVAGNPDPVASTISVEVRKGIWMPLPSFELGGGFTHLVNSHMFTVNIFAKFAIHEGFQGWPTPALAVRGYFQRLVGTRQVDFTTLSLDVSLSKSFGIAGSFNMTPYLGYNVLWFIAKSDVIDSTPGHDALQCSDGRCDTDPGGAWTRPLPNGAYCNTSADSDCNGYYVFFDQKAILRHRVFFGVRLYFTVSTALRLTFTTEYSFTIEGLSDDSLYVGNTLVTLQDDAPMQHSWGFAVGLDY